MPRGTMSMNTTCKGARIVLFLLQVLSALAVEENCGENGVCEAVYKPPKKCGRFATASSSKDIYRYGGTAQAYKPNQPEKTLICEGYDGSSQRVASWPFSRSYWKFPPRLSIDVTLWSCDAASAKNDYACCHPLSKEDSGTTIEMWQPRPDGSYASLHPGTQDGDCRAKQAVDIRKNKSTASFETVAPGSTGSLGGLGPFGWDTFPFGPPVLHMLITGPRHESILVDIPVSTKKNALEQSSFGWFDLRGAAWVQSKEKGNPYEISSWKVDKEKNTVGIGLDVYLNRLEGKEPNRELCRSWIYGLPSSFFVEPIAECAPGMLDFFSV